MQMTESEIIGSYNRTDDKKSQVQILAELNACDKETIQQILIKNGIPQSEFTTPKKRGRKKSAEKAPAKPNPAEAVADMPQEERFLLPFEDYDLGIGDDEYNSGAISGGEGDIDLGEPVYRAYRGYEQLLNEPDDMTPEERERLVRIKAIPETVRRVLNAELRSLHNQVMELEKKHDEINDFLNGELA